MFFKNCKNPINLMFLNIQVIAIVLRLFFNFALKLSLSASSFAILLYISIGILISYLYFLKTDEEFTAIEGI